MSMNAAPMNTDIFEFYSLLLWGGALAIPHVGGYIDKPRWIKFFLIFLLTPLFISYASKQSPFMVSQNAILMAGFTSVILMSIAIRFQPIKDILDKKDDNLIKIIFLQVAMIMLFIGSLYFAAKTIGLY